MVYIVYMIISCTWFLNGTFLVPVTGAIMENKDQKTKRNDGVNTPTRKTSLLHNPGINAVHVDAARQMVQMHTSGRRPNRGEPNNLTAFTPSVAPSTFVRPQINVSVPAKLEHGPCHNPQCDHCGQVIIPSPKSSFPIVDRPSITVGNWSIFRIKQPILSSAELDALELRFEFPLPEMIFGNNSIKIQNDKTGATIEFNGLDALDTLEKASDLRVSYHKEWLDSRRSNSPSTKPTDGREKATKDLGGLTDLETVKPYDWTYSTNYKGTVSNAEFTSANKELPIQKLLKPDPILFFDELVLFEDELGDNGISMLSIKIRVMHTCLLVLCRFFLRIDNVIFRIRDTRFYIDLETNEVLREYKVQEGPYDQILQKIKAKVTTDPKSLMRDVNWISQNLPVISCEIEELTAGKES